MVCLDESALESVVSMFETGRDPKDDCSLLIVEVCRCVFDHTVLGKVVAGAEVGLNDSECHRLFLDPSGSSDGLESLGCSGSLGFSGSFSWPEDPGVFGSFEGYEKDQGVKLCGKRANWA